MMQDEKLIELFQVYAKGWWTAKLDDDKYPIKSFEPVGQHGGSRRVIGESEALAHASWMAEQAIGFVKEAQAFEQHHTTEHGARSKREKAHRWLGFIQGALWMAGVFSLDELKEHSHRCSDDYTEADARDDAAAMDDDARKSST